MTKNVAALEITSRVAKFAIGYCYKGNPYLLYYAEKPIAHFMNRGLINSDKEVAKVLSTFSNIEDENLRVKVDCDDLALVLPALGFEVYETTKATNLVGNEVAPLDISNVLLLVEKETIPNNNLVVDIVPDYYLLSNGECYSDEPLGRATLSLTMKAKIHTLPEALINSYKKTCEEAKYRVRQSSISPHCASMLINSNPKNPESYFLIDIGASLTTVSLIGKKSLYGSLVFYRGGEDITKAISEKFSISFDEAEALKIKYGFDETNRAYETPINISGKTYSFSKKELTECIKEASLSLGIMIANAINSLSAKQGSASSFNQLPLIFVGGGSKLFNLEKILKESLGQQKEMIFYVPKVLGARDPSLINVLGMILDASNKNEHLSDSYHGVSTLSRGKGDK